MTRIRLAAVGLAGSLLGYSLSAAGAGFALVEQSVPGLGNAFAGAAASAEDATTIWFNPAGMTRIEGTQFIGAAHVITPNLSFRNRGSSTTIGASSLPTRGRNGRDAGSTAFVPNLYYKRDIMDSKLQFGLGINVPFGQKTEYDGDWVGRYHAIKSVLKTININPSVAGRVWRGLSLGAGVSALYGDVELTQKLDLGAVIGAPGAYDLFVDVDDADDWTYSANVGAMYEFTERTRIGVSYRPSKDLDLKGRARFTYAAGTPPLLKAAFSDLRNTNAEAKLKLPDTFEIGGYHAFNDRFAVMLGSTWYNWDRLEKVTLEFGTGRTRELDFSYNDTWRHSLGATYTTANDFIWRLGFAYDESPVDNRRTRSARLPDTDRYWATAGFTWPAADNLKLDVSYAHLFFYDTDIDQTVDGPAPGITHTLTGEYETDVDIISAQLTYNFN